MKEEIIDDKIVDKNIVSRTTTINIIKSIKNLTITCKKTDTKETYYPSSLIQEFPLKEINTNELVSYSELSNKLKLARNLDNLIKYGVKSDLTSLLYSNYGIPYGSYSNKFTGIDSKEFLEYIDSKLYLSYSSLDTYNKCSFRYYLSNILKLDIYEETFGAYIGSLFHYVLQKCLTEEKNLEEEINFFVSNNKRKLTTKETFYVNKLTKELNELLKFLKEQIKYTDLLNFMFEKKITVEKKNKTNCFFTGIIDKVMFKENNSETIMSLIDYKTYHVETDLRLLPLGLNMQLPIYLYLSKTLTSKRIVYSGFYTEQILNNSVIRNDKNLYMLNGYSNSDPEVIGLFDKTYNNSEFIASLKTKSDGDFYSYSKVLNNKQIENVINLADKIIDETIEKIEGTKFDINPKYITQNISCEYCKFNDICFKNEGDTVYLEVEKDLSFLGGEINE
jgi:ATP-dependent helicase/nuclease subunit B